MLCPKARLPAEVAMNRLALSRLWVWGLVALWALSMAMAQPKHSTTIWQIEASLAYDALGFIDVLTGIPSYQKPYLKEYNQFSRKLTAPVGASLAALAEVYPSYPMPLSELLITFFAAQSPDSLDDLIKIAGNPEALHQALEAQKTSIFYHDTYWPAIRRLLPNVRKVLLFLKATGFEAYWRSDIYPLLEAKALGLREYSGQFNVISAVEKRLGHGLDSNIVILYLTYFPSSGTRLGGMRFVEGFAVSDEAVVRGAIHELFHPPFDRSDHAFWNAIGSVKGDAFLMDRYYKRGAGYPYSFEGYVEENAVRALAQLVAEELGIAQPIATRWRRSEDDGLYVLAPVLYLLMRQERLAQSNEGFQGFLIRMVKEGKLVAGGVEALYKQFLSTSN